jgi:hypothetical protein
LDGSLLSRDTLAPLFELAGLTVTVGGTVWWLLRSRARGVDTRPAITAREVLVAAFTCGVCLLASALAVATLEPLGDGNLGLLALAYHERSPTLFLVPGALLILVLASALPRFARAAMVFFIGAATANLLSPLIWNGAVPDYLVLARIDVIANLADLVIVATGALVVTAILTGPLWYRLAHTTT